MNVGGGQLFSLPQKESGRLPNMGGEQLFRLHAQLAPWPSVMQLAEHVAVGDAAIQRACAVTANAWSPVPAPLAPPRLHRAAQADQQNK